MRTRLALMLVLAFAMNQAYAFTGKSLLDRENSGKSVFSTTTTDDFLSLKKKKKRRGSSFGLGANMSFMKAFGGGVNIGLGAKGFFARGEKSVMIGGVSYYLPTSVPVTDYGYAYSSWTDPSNITIEGKMKYSAVQISFGYARYFKGDFEDDFNIYGGLGVGLMLYTAKYEMDDYDHNLYYTTIPTESEKFSGFIISGALGFEKDLDFAYLFGEAALSIPANTVNGMEIEVEIPGSIGLNTGLRFKF